MGRTHPASQDHLDAATTRFYDRYAAQLIEQPEAKRSAISKRFPGIFRRGERVLDVGAGSGRDMVRLLDQGCDTYGVEPNDSMRALALKTYPNLAGRIAIGTLPSLGKPFGGNFDGIVCSAVLMHVLPQDVETALAAMSSLLLTGGRFLISFPALDTKLSPSDRDDDGRLFTNHAPDSVAESLARTGLREIDRWNNDTVLKQSGIRWQELLFVR